MSKKANPREIALTLLHRVIRSTQENIPLPALIACEENYWHLNNLEKSYLNEITYGVLRSFSWLDRILNGFVSHPKHLSPLQIILLKIACYEILFIKNIPFHATVNEAVRIARKRFGKRQAGLVNAVLRKVTASSSEILAVTQQHESDMYSHPEGLSQASSIPLWLAVMWCEHYGNDIAGRLASYLLSPPPFCWRINAARAESHLIRKKCIAEGCEPFGAYGLSLSFPASKKAHSMQNFLQWEKSGLISRQGRPSQLVAEFISLTLSQSVQGKVSLWDCCCGRGGKTTALAEQGVTVALASDPSSFRIDALRQQFVRIGLKVPPVRCATAQEIYGMVFQSILVDAPCSGTGTLARNPELKYRISKEKLNYAVLLQRKILESAWTKLRRGGVLFYSTCALNYMENEGQVMRFVAEHSGASLEFQRMFFASRPGEDSLFLAMLHKDV